MNKFPRMLYKHGGPEEIHGGRFHTRIVQDQDEQDAALADGWYKTTPDAKDAAKVSSEAAKQKAAGAGNSAGQADNAPPTRDELKRKADDLGLSYPSNISTEKLAALVDAALAGGESKD